MASPLIRKLQKIFGDTGGTGEFGELGSKAAGSAATSKDLDNIQNRTQYLQGLFAITSDQGTSRLPYSEDINSLHFLATSQLKYLFQAGIAEWLNDADQEYYSGESVVQRNGSVYIAIKGDGGANINVQKDPETETEWWRLIYSASPVEAYKIAEAAAYESAGVLVERYGKHYSSTGLAGNAGKDPADPVNADYWFESKGADLLESIAKAGDVVPGGMHNINDRAGAQYAQDLLIDQVKKGATTYDLTRVALDGTVVTGDTNLEDDIFKIGTADQYFYADIFCPDVVGTRTLLDVGEHIMTPQSSSGENDTLGALQDDRFQGWQTRIKRLNNGQEQSVGGGATSGILITTTTTTIDLAQRLFGVPETDGVNGTPRFGLTTRPKEFTEGVASIIVMHT